jgi:hypothetical protein
MKFVNLSLLAITSIIFICFWRTLGSYFVADDFSQVSYVWSIFNGNWGALLSNFAGNYLQIPVMKIYRPCLLLSLVFDYAIWHTNAFGYFLTNILTMLGASVMLFFLLREMTRSWEDKRSLMFSFLSAALFASYPLHCESISFVSGRDNLISAFFYLLTLWCFVKTGAQVRSKKLVALGVIAYFIAMLSKETAIGLPLVLTGAAFFLPEAFNESTGQQAQKDSFRKSLRSALEFSTPIWLTAGIYLVIRFFALGTVTGGYTGGIGAELMRHALERWTNLDTVFKLAFPLNVDVFGTQSVHTWILCVLYTASVTLFLRKLLAGEHALRWLGFWSLWTLTTMIPLYQLWVLTDNLTGARFFFFLSIPLAMLIPLLLLAPSEKSMLKEGASTVSLKTEPLAVALPLGLVIVYTSITFQNNVPWVHAGKQTRACLREGEKLANSLIPGKKCALIGLPMVEGGAHVIYNGATFNAMMSPPFSMTDYANKFVLFDPLFYGPEELINTQRFKKVLSDPDIVGLFVWNKVTLRFDQVNRLSREPILSSEEAVIPINFQKSGALTMTCAANNALGNGNRYQISAQEYDLRSTPLRADPHRYDFLELDLKGLLPKEPIFVLWKGEEPDWQDSKHPAHELALDAPSGTKIRIRLSDHWRWFTQGKIARLRLDCLPGQSIKLSDVRLVSDRGLIPSVTVVNSQASNLGVYPAGNGGVSLDIDATGIQGCKAVKIEISKPNYFFEGMSKEESEDAVMATLTQPTCVGRVDIEKKIFASKGYYELRVGCLDHKGLDIGEKSDPITIGI